MKHLLLAIILLSCINTANAQIQDDDYNPKAIDLGLPSGMLWADRNIGYNTQEIDHGIYYTWGGIISYPDNDSAPRAFTWGTYKHGKGKRELTKYCTDSSFGTKDGKTQLDSEDDAVQMYGKTHSMKFKVVIWDDNWRMPTEKDFEELMEKCTWTWEDHSGFGGYRVKGPNGNSIYLPAAGYCQGGGAPIALGNTGCYWTSTLCADFPCYAYSIIFDEESIAWNNGSRYIAYSIRPVKNKK